MAVARETEEAGRLGRWLALVGPALLGGLLLLPACGLLHLCGYRAPWAGAAARCNVHSPLGPRCPWCEHPALGGAATLAVAGGQWAAARALLRRGAPWWGAGAAGLAAGVPLVLLSGALAWLPTDYPHFLARDARERLGLPEGPISCVARPRPARPGLARCCAD